MTDDSPPDPIAPEVETAVSDERPDEQLDERRREQRRKDKKKKNLKKLQAEFEVLTLSPWERFRALSELSRQHIDLVEMADRKTRFGLVILAALNTVNLVMVVRPDILTGAAVQHGSGVAFYVAFYAILSLYLCLQAIGTLKPRLAGALLETADQSKFQKWLDLLSLDALPKFAPDDYYELWRTAQFGQLNREIAFRNQTTARIILLKYAALERLYRGLSILVGLTGVLILYLLYSRLTSA